MKNILLLLLFSNSVIAYASPPPDPTPSIIAENVQLVVQAEVQTIQPAVQEVAYVYRGNFEMASYQEYIFDPVAKLEFPAMVMNDNYFAFAQRFNKPPSILNLTGANDKQHSNYGYPFTGN